MEYGMRQSTSSTQQHHLTIRSRRSPDSTPTHSSKQDGRQHHRQAVTSIQLTSTRQRRTVPSNTDGTSRNTESPNYNITTTEQSRASIRSYQGRYGTPRIYSTDTQHMRMATPATSADGTKTTKRHSASLEKQYNTYTTNSQATTKDGTTFLQSHLVWKGHSNRRNTPGHQQQSCQS